jgi:hypothetical protein
MPNRVFTIGRSTHCIDEFMKALRNCGDLEFGPTRLSGYEMKLRISPFVQETSEPYNALMVDGRYILWGTGRCSAR